MYQAHKSTLFVIVSSAKEGEKFVEDLNFFGKTEFFQKTQFLTFPPYNILPFKFLSYHNETAAKRINLLYRLATDTTPLIVVMPVEVLLQRMIPGKELCDYAELILSGEDIDRESLISKLISGGYTRTVIVEEPGDICIRGGIIDVFPPGYSEPLRIEFSGDTVESLRLFSASSQRTLKKIDEAVLLPARETILKKDSIDQIITRLKEQAYQSDAPLARVHEIIERIIGEGVFPGIESFLPLIYPKLDTFSDYAPDNSLFILIEPNELETAANKFHEQVLKNHNTACKEGRFCVKPDSLILNWEDIKESLLQKNPVIVSESDSLSSTADSHFFIEDNSAMKEALKYHTDKENLFIPLAEWLNEKHSSGCMTLIVCRSKSQAERLISLLAPYGIKPEFVDLPLFPRKAGIYICIGNLSSGFVWLDESLAIITDIEILGEREHKRKISKKKIHTELLDFGELKKGDLIVHTEHGIGRYESLIKLKLNGSVNDFLLIFYKDEDKLYVPVERMSIIQKYMGVDDILPALDKLGGKSWERIKDKVKKSAEKIAGELLNLYAERRIRKGFAYKDVGNEFKEFEAGFSYEETPDQFKAIDDVLNDMADSSPMDRLICGDVGYGKTEIALRASFVAVNNGKQVAVLVPTTVLAEQHFAAFSTRFEKFPINIASLSRFRSLKEQRAILKELKEGKIDIVIGTHRLIQNDVVFKDLGLMIIDEEQRFGVKHKERLKKLRSTVDVLALTATPIPRTLHMAMMGIRDISIISTPPEQRHSIITYVCEFDEAIISEAITRELNRNGQIFFVHNNVHNIWGMADRLQKLVPEVRLDVAHGQLSEDELENVMLRFIKKEIDMLVCTTIIESGLDISSANTIFINRADRFGLAQIYQLRGRVGRSEEQAYAYLFIPNETLLGKDAKKRLKVLMEHSDLGSGFQIAMSDLKIRGGGTIFRQRPSQVILPQSDMRCFLSLWRKQWRI